MHWTKHGQLFAIKEENTMLHSHAMVPVAHHIEGDLFAVYITIRDTEGRGRIFRLMLDMNAKEITAFNRAPVLELGDIGTFDDNGVVPGSLIQEKNELRFYYSGINVRNTIPFSSNTGLAISTDSGATFTRAFEGPTLDRTKIEPHFSTMPYAMKDNETYKIWYLSGVRWEQNGHNLKHYYHIKYAESEDGIDWVQDGTVAIDFKNDQEYALARPCVIKDGDEDYKMWYSYRAQKNVETYRIGYATSSDGKNWTRKDEEAGIDVSDEGWDSEMICYPFIFDHNGTRYMLYNGNGYGRTGFGLARLSQ